MCLFKRRSNGMYMFGSKKVYLKLENSKLQGIFIFKTLLIYMNSKSRSSATCYRKVFKSKP